MKNQSENQIVVIKSKYQTPAPGLSNCANVCLQNIMSFLYSPDRYSLLSFQPLISLLRTNKHLKTRVEHFFQAIPQTVLNYPEFVPTKDEHGKILNERNIKDSIELDKLKKVALDKLKNVWNQHSIENKITFLIHHRRMDFDYRAYNMSVPKENLKSFFNNFLSNNQKELKQLCDVPVGFKEALTSIPLISKNEADEMLFLTRKMTTILFPSSPTLSLDEQYYLTIILSFLLEIAKIRDQNMSLIIFSHLVRDIIFQKLNHYNIYSVWTKYHVLAYQLGLKLELIMRLPATITCDNFETKYNPPSFVKYTLAFFRNEGLKNNRNNFNVAANIFSNHHIYPELLDLINIDALPNRLGTSLVNNVDGSIRAFYDPTRECACIENFYQCVHCYQRCPMPRECNIYPTFGVCCLIRCRCCLQQPCCDSEERAFVRNMKTLAEKFYFDSPLYEAIKKHVEEQAISTTNSQQRMNPLIVQFQAQRPPVLTNNFVNDLQHKPQTNTSMVRH